MTTYDRRNYCSVWVNSIQNGIVKLESQITANLTFNDLKYGTLYDVNIKQIGIGVVFAAPNNNP
jgi:hypothetical protein